jgi:arylsulfatase A-like enzyme
MIVRWKGHVTPGTSSDRITGFEDWMPTLLDLLRAKETVPRTVAIRLIDK